MIRIINVIGARPQIIKAAAISRAILNNYKELVEDIIVHTGQHYDENMSAIFFEELGIPIPKYNLKIGSSSHGIQTAKMLEGLEKIILDEKPDFIVLYGDTNSTIAAALAASKLHFPVVHIEAGLRSYNKSMPEEINRIVCDHVSTYLFTPTLQGYQNLIKEGFKESPPPYTIDNPGIFHVGDIMFDNSKFFAELASKNSTILKDNNLIPEKYVLATIHRNHNTDNPKRLESIFDAFFEIVKTYNIKLVLPLHPRTSKILKQNINKELYNKIVEEKNILFIPPVSFLDMIFLEKNAHLIMTDSGGVQKEAHFFEKPCIILRPETEWVELVDNGSAKIVDADKYEIIKAFENYFQKNNFVYPKFYGDGNASSKIIDKLIAFKGKKNRNIDSL